ncbi:MAG: phosphatase PAP2 family protein [Pseudomonadota bacterium]
MATKRESIHTPALAPNIEKAILDLKECGFSFSAALKWVKELFLFRVATLGFDLIILMIMTLLLVATVVAMGGHIRFLQATVALPLSIMTAAIVVKAHQKPGEWRSEVARILRDWVPFLIIVFIYENMHDVAGQAMDFDIAGLLHKWDIMLFGLEPTIWAQKIHSPLATDLLSISYALYFAEPLFIMFLLSTWEKRKEFRHMALCLTLTFILGFLGYVFLPASPPRYFIEHLFTDPVRLHGVFLFGHLQDAWDGLSVISGGAFPSLHVGISAVALIYAFKYRKLNRTCRLIWYAYVPLVASLWFSTIYLRHHWAIDIFAGWAVAFVAYLGAASLMRVWGRLRARYGLPF